MTAPLSRGKAVCTTDTIRRSWELQIGEEAEKPQNCPFCLSNPCLELLLSASYTASSYSELMVRREIRRRKRDSLEAAAAAVLPSCSSSKDFAANRNSEKRHLLDQTASTSLVFFKNILNKEAISTTGVMESVCYNTQTSNDPGLDDL